MTKRPKPMPGIKGGSSTTALKPSTYKPKNGYKPGGPYDPEVVEWERRKRHDSVAGFDSERPVKPWKRGSKDQGAMIRTNTHVPGVAVAREKIAELRKKRSKGGA